MMPNFCFSVQMLVASILLCGSFKHFHGSYGKHYKRSQGIRGNPFTKSVCMEVNNTMRARHKSCFLRPDTGPCRADIIQWYHDVKLKRCFRFFWGGCQGNGNRFETKEDCDKFCALNTTNLPPNTIPHLCFLTFEYGHCFGGYDRWAWDSLDKMCKRKLYSGCGGNQNNFETEEECFRTCMHPSPEAESQENLSKQTTRLPYDIPNLF